MTASRYRDDGEEDDWEDVEESFDDEDDEPTVPCPFCGSDILEDSPYCPHCERYVSEDDHAAAGKPPWVIVTALICLGMAVWWVLAAF